MEYLYYLYSMKTIKKVLAGDLIEQISGKLSFVAPCNSWIVCNSDGSYYLDPKDGYIIHKVKKIAQEIANSL